MWRFARFVVLASQNACCPFALACAAAPMYPLAPWHPVHLCVSWHLCREMVLDADCFRGYHRTTARAQTNFFPAFALRLGWSKDAATSCLRECSPSPQTQQIVDIQLYKSGLIVSWDDWSRSLPADPPSVTVFFVTAGVVRIYIAPKKAAEEIAKPGLSEKLGLDSGVLEAYDAAWRATAEDDRDGVHPIRLVLASSL